MLTKQQLRVGNKIDIFWSRDHRSYPATITAVTEKYVDVIYDDGQKKTYQMTALCNDEAGMSMLQLHTSGTEQKTSVSESESKTDTKSTQDSLEKNLPVEYRVGNRISIWWSRDKRSYRGTIINVSDSHIEVLYDDNQRKTYPMGATSVAIKTIKRPNCSPHLKQWRKESKQQLRIGNNIDILWPSIPCGHHPRIHGQMRSR